MNNDYKSVHPFFSIITVVYNAIDHIKPTVTSIIEQSINNIEYIIIDGASTDGTVDFLQNLKDDAVPIILVSEKDNGIYDAMNKGMHLARGDYIIFMNAGDRFTDDNTLSLIQKHITSTNYPSFIYGDAVEIDEAGALYYRPARSVEKKQIGMFTHHQSMVYKRAIIAQYQLYYDTSYKIAADYKFTCEFLNHATTLHYISQPLSIFLQGGLSQRQWMQSMGEQIPIKQEVLNMPYWKIYLIYAAQIAWHGIKVYFPWIYRSIRFRKNDHA